MLLCMCTVCEICSFIITNINRFCYCSCITLCFSLIGTPQLSYSCSFFFYFLWSNQSTDTKMRFYASGDNVIAVEGKSEKSSMYQM